MYFRGVYLKEHTADNFEYSFNPAVDVQLVEKASTEPQTAQLITRLEAESPKELADYIGLGPTVIEMLLD